RGRVAAALIVAAGNSSLPRLGTAVRRLRRCPRGPRPPQESRGGEDPDEDEHGPGEDCDECTADRQRPKQEQDCPEDSDVAEPARKWPSPPCSKPVHSEASRENKEAEDLDGAESDDGLRDDDRGRLRNTSRRVRTREHIQRDCLPDEHHRRDDNTYEPPAGRGTKQP